MFLAIKSKGKDVQQWIERVTIVYVRERLETWMCGLVEQDFFFNVRRFQREQQGPVHIDINRN